MIEFPPGVMIEIDSGCYPDYKVAKVLKRTELGYIVILDGYTLDGIDFHGQTIIFDSEVIGMADDDILEKVRSRGRPKSKNNPATIDPKVLRDAMDILKKKVQEKVPDAKKVKDPIEAPRHRDTPRRSGTTSHANACAG